MSTSHQVPVAAALETCEGGLHSLGPIGTWPASMRVMFRMMLDAKQPMSLVWGDERRLLYNDPYVEFLGEKHPWALGRKLDEVWPEIWDDIGPLVDRARAGEAFHMEDVPLRIRRSGGEERTWFTYFISPARDEEGCLRGMYSSVVETTARVLGERRQAHLLELTDGLANMRSPADAIDAAGRVLVAYLEPLAGCRVEAAGSDGPPRIEEITGDADATAWQAALDALEPARGTDPVTLCVPTPAAGTASVPGTLLALRTDRPDGAPTHLYFAGTRVWTEPDVEFAREVGRRVAAAMAQWATAEALRELTDSLEASVAERTAELVQARAEAVHIAQRLQLALDSAEIGDWDLDLVTDASYRSLRHDQCFGYSAPIPEWGFETFIQHVHPEDRERVAKAFRDAIEQFGIWRFECRVIWPDGSLHWIAAHGAVYERGGAPSRMAGVVMDITARKAVDQELRQSNQRKDEFLAMLAHELRNPLAPIGTTAQILKRSSHDPARVVHAAEVVERQVAHLTTLVDDLLDVSRVTRGLVAIEHAPVDIRAVVSAAMEQVQPLVRERRHELRTAFTSDALVVDGDFHRLVQVVSNLLANAAKYTPQGGEIDLRASLDGPDVVIAVRDNGIGISPDLLGGVFELFTQGERSPDRAQGGLGIGLALVRSLVSLHGGTVSAYSDGPHRGSTFKVRLPRLDRASISPEVAPVGEPISTGRRILLVDDNRDAADTLAELLVLMGHHVRVAPDAASGIEAAGSEHWDTYILDIGLPDMTGFELVEHLRAARTDDNVMYIALTGYGQSHDRLMSKAAGFDHHMVKPPDVAKLLEILDRR